MTSGNVLTIVALVVAGVSTFFTYQISQGVGVSDIILRVDGIDGRLETMEAHSHTVEALDLDREFMTSVSEAMKGRFLTEATLSTRILQVPFNDVREAAEIRGSQGAVLCALSRIDDDTCDGWCQIDQRDDIWFMQTGAGSGEQNCSAICLFIALNTD